LKKTTAVFIALALCVAVFALYFIISNISDKDGEGANEDVYLYVDQNDISKISSFSFVGGEFDLSFEKNESGAWKYSKNGTLPVNENIIEKMLESTKTVLATKIISEDVSQDELSQYGLDSPSYKLKLSSDHGEKCYLFGDLIKSKGLRYMMREGSHTVYLAEDTLVESFSNDLTDCLSTDTFPIISEEEIVSFETVCGSFSLLQSVSENEKLANALSSLSPERAVDFGKENFSIYGLSESESILVSITLKNSKEIKIKFGLGETEEFIYALVHNDSGVFSEMIYLVTCEDFDGLYSHLAAAAESSAANGENK